MHFRCETGAFMLVNKHELQAFLRGIERLNEEILWAGTGIFPHRILECIRYVFSVIHRHLQAKCE